MLLGGWQCSTDTATAYLQRILSTTVRSSPGLWHRPSKPPHYPALTHPSTFPPIALQPNEYGHLAQAAGMFAAPCGGGLLFVIRCAATPNRHIDPVSVHIRIGWIKASRPLMALYFGKKHLTPTRRSSSKWIVPSPTRSCLSAGTKTARRHPFSSANPVFGRRQTTVQLEFLAGIDLFSTPLAAGLVKEFVVGSSRDSGWKHAQRNRFMNAQEREQRGNAERGPDLLYKAAG